MNLWSLESEKEFFSFVKGSASIDQLFYRLKDGRYLTYWPKRYKGRKSTIQGRNAIIGNYTEKWCYKLFSFLLEGTDLVPVRNVICPELELSANSPADLAICTSNDKHQSPENIKAIFEIKMSLVWNWELINPESFEVRCVGDFTTHQGTPGILRSDSMLKAIGKSINVRLASFHSSNIPIVILSNTPITKHYYHKVDTLRNSGIIQGFWSLNPNPLINSSDKNNEGYNIQNTPLGGFYRFHTIDELRTKVEELIKEEFEFFSSMRPKEELGKIIETANKGKTYKEKAELFLNLIRMLDKDE